MDEKQIVFTAKINGFEMDYMKFGSGANSLVILPGMSLMSVMPLAPLCAGTYKLFTEDYTVYLFDRRKKFDKGYSIEDMARDTALVMKTLGISGACFLGISQGGAIAQTIAEEYPELVNKLALAATSSRANEVSTPVFREWIRLTKAGNIDDLVSFFIDTIYTERAAKLCKKVVIEANRAASELDKNNFIAMAESCICYDRFRELEKIKSPTFVVGGGLDQVFSANASIEIYERLKSCGTPCELFIYEGYNHAVYDEAPDFRKRVLEFFRK